MGRPQNSFEPYLNPKNSLLGPQKVKNYPKIKSKVRIEGTIEIFVIISRSYISSLYNLIYDEMNSAI